MSNNVTMRDIAEKLGVSSVTVSKALNDKEGVSDELKKKIKSVAEAMGYRLNLSAKAMKEGYSYNVGVIIAERYTGLTQSFYTRFYQHIATALEQHLYSGILHILSAEDEEKRILPRVYHEQKVDGFIILGQLDRNYLEVLRRAEIAFVCLDFYTDETDADSIITDNFYGMYEMTNYLINQGHTELAFVGNIYATSSIQDRFLGFYKSLLEHRIPLKDEYVIDDRDEKGKFLDIRLPDKLPTAFVCNCDQVAYELINKLQQEGIKVPDDVSVTGFDNDIYATIITPRITTVEVDMSAMAATAAQTIVQKVKNSAFHTGRVLIKGQIIHRDSVKCLV